MIIQPKEIAGNSRQDVDSIGDEAEFTAKQRLKIVDFGFSARFRPSKYDQMNQNIGTTLYMAPEQISGSAYGRKIDVYATGVTMYYLLAGHHPLYKITDSLEAFKQKLIKTPP